MENTGKKCRWAVKALLALVWLVVAGVVCYAALIGLVYYWEVNVPEPTDYDSIIVLGAQVLPSGEPSVQLRWRLDKAKEYYEKHPCYMVVTGGQGGQVPAPGGSVHHPADQALQVGDLLQAEHHLLPGDDVLHQIAHRLLPAVDLHRGEEGPLHPAPNEPVAHGGFRLIHHPQQGALFLFAPQSLGELQGLPGGEVQL